MVQFTCGGKVVAEFSYNKERTTLTFERAADGVRYDGPKTLDLTTNAIMEIIPGNLGECKVDDAILEVARA